MTTDLDGLIGQSLMLQIQGDEATPELLDALARIRPCGVILFAANIRTPAGVYELVRRMQAKARALGMPPLLIAIDQEGGNVSRLPLPFTTVPSQMAQAATGDVDVAHDCAVITGRQLRSVGINTNFAPVLDVNSNPANPVIGTRSFGEDPDVVTRFGLAAMRGYRETNIIATVKHFPGHGDTAVDSHVGLPVVDHDVERLMRVEIAPFVAAIEAGVPAVMAAHIIFTALDDQPATLSRPILHDLLRRDLGFEGVIFTDALDMAAITDRYGPTDAARLANDAGADVLLAMGTPDLQMAMAESLRAATKSGTLPPDRFADTARRLDAVRSAYRLTHELPPFVEPDNLLTERALAIAQRSLTVAHGHESLPLPAHSRLTLVDCLPTRWSPAEEAADPARYLFGLVRGAFAQTTGVAASAESLSEAAVNAEQLARASDAILLVTRNAAKDDYQARLGRTLAATGIPLIHAAVRSPYAVPLPGAAATLLTYGDPPVSLQALVASLAGKAEAGGRLPVSPVDAGADED